MGGYKIHPDYEKLPDALKYVYTPQEYAWMGDEERARILDYECYPDFEEDDY